MTRGLKLAWVLPVIACHLLSGCTEGPTTPPASTPTPPGSAPAAAQSASSIGVYDGLYVGTTVSMRPASISCPAELTVRNFRVVGDQVEFGGFRGPIQRDGSVQILNRDVRLTGRFSGTEFRGEFTQYGGGRRYYGTRGGGSNHRERCTYATALRREAS